MKTQSTNGYQIRLEVLRMAKEMVEQDYYTQKETLMQDYETRKHVAFSSDNPQVVDLPKLPSFPTSADITSKAQELYAFVTTKE
jgi:hypothetical protein